jgi:hypothetical protein
MKFQRKTWNLGQHWPGIPPNRIAKPRCKSRREDIHALRFFVVLLCRNDFVKGHARELFPL